MKTESAELIIQSNCETQAYLVTHLLISAAGQQNVHDFALTLPVCFNQRNLASLVNISQIQSDKQSQAGIEGNDIPDSTR